MSGILLFVLLLSRAEGFYKDVFMDGGTGLTGRTRLYAAESLGLSLEFISAQDSILLRRVITGCSLDDNGYLLYPDGAPRFRVIFTNGGDAVTHSRALGDSGRQRIRQFFAAGGSYTGACAGAYLASLSNQDSGISPYFYHLWPGRTKNTAISSAWVGNFIPQNSPLLAYDSFGGDFYISGLYLNGGPYANESLDWPAGTEVLLRYDTLGHPAHNRCAGWAWKGADTSGRVVVIGTHPEGFSSGERLHLMMAVLRYALDGVGLPRLKAVLQSGVPRIMDRGMEAPEFARIGDRQYHHFAIDVPPGAESLCVLVQGADSFQLNLYLKWNGFAFRSSCDFADTAPGAGKLMTVRSPAGGMWYIGVECATTVNCVNDSFPVYFGRMEVLNGVPYSVNAWWGGIGIAEDRWITLKKQPGLSPNPARGFCNLYLPAGKGEIAVFDRMGRKVQNELAVITSCGSGVYHLRFARSLPAGVYLITGPGGFRKPLVLLR
ncbi:MAG: BPL-N domain-containing protein [candidate division WOR-3 bacterium]